MLPAEQLRPKIARRREQWRKYQARLDPARLVFIDETWAKTNMAPLRGWAPVGRRLDAKVPYGHWRAMTFIAALRHDRIDAPFVFDQPINAMSFLAWVEHQLAPTLRAGDIVILDNLSSHKNPAIRAAIRAAGARLLFLPPTVPTSTRRAGVGLRPSSTPPSSSTCCAKPPNAPPKPPGSASARSSTPSPRPNAATTSLTPDMRQRNLIRL